MRRLIDAFITALRARARAQHVADLQQMLIDLTLARAALDAEIEETRRRFIAANSDYQAFLTTH